MLITGARKGIGRYLAEYYLKKNFFVFGCSRGETDLTDRNYRHYCLDISDEQAVKRLFKDLNNDFGKLDVLINNAGMATMNHSLLTPLSSVRIILETNVVGCFLFSREAAKIMKKNNYGRIVNFSTIAVPLKLAGEAIYASSKAAVNNLTSVMAKEFSGMGITINAVGPTPVKTDLIRNIPDVKIQELINKQTIKRFGSMNDITNVIDFFIKPESSFITGQIIYLGGL